MTNITSETTIKVLREIFVHSSLPKIIEPDNGPLLTSDSYADFCAKNGISHIRVTLYRPKLNSLAERTMRTFKVRMRSSDQQNSQFDRLQSFLFSYRDTVRRSTSRTPSELILEANLIC